jgi:hypothetical protein
VLVVPAEEQAIAGDQAEEGDTGAKQPTPLAIMGPEPVQQKEIKATEMAPLAIGEPEQPHQEETGVTEVEEDPQGNTPQPTEGRREEPKAAVKYKKVISQKKAGKQARTIVVSMPKEEEEIVDVGARPKRRERPRKAPGMDPPDPHKGSVPDPGKGVCADPVNGGAILGKGGAGSPRREQGASVEPR